MRRRLLGLLAAVVAAVAVVGPQAVAPAGAVAVPASFTVTGAGFGHGVGLSQYGALGQALEGRTATEILTHYFTKATVRAVPDWMNVRVNVLHAVSSVTLRSQPIVAGGGKVEVQGTGRPVVPGTSADVWTLTVDGTQVAVRRGSAVVYTAPAVTVRWAGTRYPGGTGTVATDLLVGGRPYRYGVVDVRVVSGRLEVVNTVRLHDEYLLGLGEMPSSWPTAALQAQVIAARSYALTRYHAGLRSACACNLYNNTYDQVFVGWSKESGTDGGRWRAAVEATLTDAKDGLGLLYGGQPIAAYYSSSTGGRTQNSEDVWVSAVPWARGVDDHWSLDPSINPYASWTRSVTQAQLATVFGLPDVVRYSVTARYHSGGAATVRAWSSSGASSTRSGEQLRTGLGLPSSYLSRPTTRLAGADRWSTAVAVGKVAAPTGSSVVIVSGENGHLVDGMVAAPLARQLGAPILLARSTGLPPATNAELLRRDSTTAWLVGGEQALGPDVVTALQQLGVTTVHRLSGTDRFATAQAVAAQLKPTSPRVVVVNGDSLPDALSASGPAGGAGLPVLLVKKDSVPAPTRQALASLRPTSALVVGGTSVVSESVRTALPQATRAGGVNRYATSVAVAEAFHGALSPSQVVVVSGLDTSLVDALAASALGRITVFSSAVLPGSVATWLNDTPEVQSIVVVGGPVSVPDLVLRAASQA